MKLRLRRQDAASNGTARLPSGKGVARQSPPSAVTSWLRQGLRNDISPLCRVAHRLTGSTSAFLRRAQQRHGAVDEVRHSYGFCAEHIEMFRRIDVENMRTTLTSAF